MTLFPHVAILSSVVYEGWREMMIWLLLKSARHILELLTAVTNNNIVTHK